MAPAACWRAAERKAETGYQFPDVKDVLDLQDNSGRETFSSGRLERAGPENRPRKCL